MSSKRKGEIMNKLKIIFTMFFLSVSIDTVQGMHVDEVKKGFVLKRATLDNSTQSELWVRLLKTNPTELVSLRGLLEPNKSRIIKKHDSPCRTFSIIISYTPNLVGAVIVPLETLYKNYDVRDEGSGLFIREILQEL